MKRLAGFIRAMDNNTTTYVEMYNGRIGISDGTSRPPIIDYEPTYYHGKNGEIGITITGTNKLAQDKPTVTIAIPAEMLGIDEFSPAAADFCLREFNRYIDELNAELYNRSRPDNENGKFYCHKPNGEVLVRNTAYFAMCMQKYYENMGGCRVLLIQDDNRVGEKMCLCLRILVQLPMKKIKKTLTMLCRSLPDAIDRFIAEFDQAALDRTIELSHKQTAIREWLKTSEYCAFIATGSILPRAKGTHLPMKNALPFKPADGEEIEVCGVRGMGIRRGVTVITGGGYSGKSTILDAISAGIYDHVAGDGRELCITDSTAVTISAEDGRSVKSVNISPFIKWLPNGDTADFSTDHASGSTSQAANIMEAVDCGAKLLLIDEDRSATNFMIRDGMMKELIEKEPITPFTDRAAELYREQGVSTILVIGGSGEYLAVADKIYLMDEFIISNVTEKVREICGRYGVSNIYPTSAYWSQHRMLLSENFTSYPENSGSERLMVSDMGLIFIGDEKIDLRGLHDIVSPRQLDAMGFILRWLEVSNKDIKIDLSERVHELYMKIAEEGLDCVFSSFFTTCERFLDLPREYEVIAAINRMRKISFRT